MTGPVYLDCNGSTPLEPRVQAALLDVLQVPGNPHADHGHGRALRHLYGQASERLGALLGVEAEGVVPTSGATEALHLAHMGVRDVLAASGRRHVVIGAVEHGASRGAAEALTASLCGDLTVVPCGSDGRVEAERLLAAVREDTGFVSLMHVNNETGAVQPLQDVARGLSAHPALLHVDAAQGFGKATDDLLDGRIDLLSLSAHKLHGPVGVGALVARPRGRSALEAQLPGHSGLSPLRPGTPPVALLHAFMVASELAVSEESERRAKHDIVRSRALDMFRRLGAVVHTPLAHALPHVLSVALPGLDGEVARMALADLVTVGNGSACHAGVPSPVLEAMGVDPALAQATMRWSWSHLTGVVPWGQIEERLRGLQRGRERGLALAG